MARGEPRFPQAIGTCTLQHFLLERAESISHLSTSSVITDTECSGRLIVKGGSAPIWLVVGPRAR
jgi:hypothetical protein